MLAAHSRSTPINRYLPSRLTCLKRASGSPILFDHLVGADEQRVRHGNAERGGGLQIDGELDGGGLFDRDVGRRRAVQDFDELAGKLGEIPTYGRTVTHESALIGITADQGCNHLAAARAGAGYRLHCDGRTESLPVAFQRSPPSDEIERTLLETFGVSGVCPKGETIGG